MNLDFPLIKDMERIMYTNNSPLVVSDVMIVPGSFPTVNENELFRTTLEKMNNSQLGIACIINENRKLLAVITDGDIRRILLAYQKPLASLFIEDILDYSSSNFKYVTPNMTLKEAIIIMGDDKVWDLPVINSTGKLLGLLHLHPAIKEVMKQCN